MFGEIKPRHMWVLNRLNGIAYLVTRQCKPDVQAPHRSSPIWTDDSVEIGVCPRSDGCSQYIVNAKGLTLGGHFEYGYTPGGRHG